MPNWCVNHLEVIGHVKIVNKFKKFARGYGNWNEDGKKSPLDFCRFVPYPISYKVMDKEKHEIEQMELKWRNSKNKQRKKIILKKLKKTTATYELKWKTRLDGYNSGGYEWCQKHWGVKWNASETSVHEGAERKGIKTISYDFQTPWCQPTPVIEAMKNLFPDLQFSMDYEEPGMGFSGNESF